VDLLEPINFGDEFKLLGETDLGHWRSRAFKSVSGDDIKRLSTFPYCRRVKGVEL